MEQICNKSNLYKSLDEFTKCKPCSNGVRGTCKTCTRKYMVKYQETNSDKISEYNKEYRLANSEKNKGYKNKIGGRTTELMLVDIPLVEI